MPVIDYEKINSQVVNVFNNVIIIQEDYLKNSAEFSDMTLKEMHTIDAVGRLVDPTVSDIANFLMITNSTVTISLNNLERKGYIQRSSHSRDRRVVNIVLTEKGKQVYKGHLDFHRTMVDRIVQSMSEENVEALIKGLDNLNSFLEEIKANR